jgi:hypothetical protein
MPQSNISNREVRSAIHSLPPWITRWGNGIIIALVTIAFVICYFIKFGDMVSIPINVQAVPLPRTISLNEDGAIITQQPNNTFVNKDDTLFKLVDKNKMSHFYTAPFAGQVKYVASIGEVTTHYQNENILTLLPEKKHFVFSTLSNHSGLPSSIRKGQECLLTIPGNPEFFLDGYVTEIVESSNSDSSIILFQLNQNIDSLLSLGGYHFNSFNTSCEIIVAKTTLLQKLIFRNK